MILFRKRRLQVPAKQNHIHFVGNHDPNRFGTCTGDEDDYGSCTYDEEDDDEHDDDSVSDCASRCTLKRNITRFTQEPNLLNY